MLAVVSAALDASDDLLLVLDVDATTVSGLRIHEASDAFVRCIGHARGALIGRPLECIAAEPWAETLAPTATAVRRGAALRGDLPCVAADGRHLWLGLHLMPAPADARAVPRFVLIGRDITARRHAAEQSRKLQSLLAHVFALAEAPLAIVGADGRFRMTNACLDRLLGQGQGVLTNRPCGDCVAPIWRHVFADCVGRQGEDGRPFTLELELLGPESARLPVALHSVLLERERQGARLVTLNRLAGPLPRHLVAGHIRLVSLDAVRATLGERWPAVAARVRETAESMIRKRIGPADRCGRTGEDDFILSFADANEAEATARAASIARDIRHHLIGRGEAAEAVEIRATVATVPPGSDAQIGRHFAALEAATPAAPPRPPLFVPLVGAATGEPVAEYLRLAPPHLHEGHVAFPVATIEQDILLLRAASGIGDAERKLLVRVDFDHFLVRVRTEAYFEACRAVPAALRGRLHIVLGGLPAGLAQGLLHDTSRRLRTMGFAVGMEIEGFALPSFDLASCQISLVRLDVAEWDHGNAVPPLRLQGLAACLHSQRAKLLAAGVGSAATARHLGAQGVDYVTLTEADR